MKRILFVDDEPNILLGLKRMLHGMEGALDLQFAESGPEALKHMEGDRFDVIVSDMRMPGMDGAELLDIVREKYPWVVRIVLSGQAEKDAIFRSVNPTHQYLAKPCEPRALRAVLQRACALGALLSNDALRSLVSRVNTLPSLPAVYMELMQELESDRASARTIGDIVATDLGMSAKVMQLISSSYFGLPRRIASPQEAVCYLGTETVKSLAVTVKVFSLFEDRGVEGFSTEGLMLHSMNAGRIANAIAGSEGADAVTRGDAQMAGMLHDVGKLLLAEYAPAEFNACLKDARTGGRALHEMEQEQLNTTHAEVGGYLLGLWGLPQPVFESVACHHNPSAWLHSRVDAPDAAPIPLWVHAANLLEHAVTAGEDPAEVRLELTESQLATVSERLPAWGGLAEKAVQKKERAA
jgi:HD-like signal output (HDOD) protein/CheY-like chemotaxis protein